MSISKVAFQIVMRLVMTVLVALSFVSCGISRGAATTGSWVDAVQVNGIHYLSVGNQGGRPLQVDDLGQEVARVRVRLAGRMPESSSPMKDGEATLLAAGTPLFMVKGYAATFRLAARQGERIMLYEALSNPNARKGSELLDIRGKVRYIGVNSPVDGTTEVAAIKDPQQVDALIAVVLDAPLEQRYAEQSSLTYFIAFHMDDGTVVSCPYMLPEIRLCQNIVLPETFREMIERTVPQGTPAANR